MRLVSKEDPIIEISLRKGYVVPTVQPELLIVL